MKRFLSILLCLALALTLYSPAFAAEKVNANLMQNISYNDPTQVNPQAIASIGDTLYLFVTSDSATEAMLYRWTPGMAAPELLHGGLSHYQTDENGKPLSTNVTNLFADGKSLYALDMESGNVKLLLDEAGTYSTETIYTLDLSQTDPDNSAKDGTDDVMNACMVSLFADGGVLYMLTQSYSEQPTRTLSRFELASGTRLSSEASPHLQALTSYRDGKLLCYWQEKTDDLYAETASVAIYDPDTKTAEILMPALSNNDIGLRYHAPTNSAYFISKSAVYRLADMSTTPQLSAYLAMESWIGRPYPDSVFLVLDSGMFVSSSYGGVSVRALDMPGIENGALTLSGEYTSLAHNAVASAHPEISVTFTSESPDDSMESLAAAMLNAEDSIDLFRFPVSYVPVSRLIAKGYAANLSALPGVAEVFSRMDERFTSPFTKDGAVYALPVSLYASTLGYDKEAWEELGLTQDDLPKTFLELLDFMANFYADYGEEHPEFSLVSDVQIENALLSRIFEQYIAAQMQKGELISFDTPLMRKLLSALSAIDFTEIDPYALMGEEFWNDSELQQEYWEKKSVFSLYASADSPSIFQSTDRITPLIIPLEEGMEPIIPANVDVMILNPRSTRLATAETYLSEYARHYSPEREDIVFFPDNNAPVENLYYEVSLAHYQKALATLQKSLETAPEEKKAEIRDQIQWTETGLKEMEQRRMLVSEDMIAKYREQISPYLYVLEQTPLTNWSSGMSSEIETQMQLYRDHAIDAETLIRELDKRIRLMLLEDE